MKHSHLGSALVTGACGVLGRAIVNQLIVDGFNVYALDVNVNGLDTLSSQHVSSGSYCSVPIDICDEYSLIKFLESPLSGVPPIKYAVHAAYPRTANWGLPLDKLDAKDLSVNLSNQLGGAIIFSKQILDFFFRNSGGSLIHLSSIQGIAAPKFSHYEGLPMTSPVEYSAIKSGIISITKWFAKYYSNSDIRVNCISPGGIIDSQPSQFLEKYRESCTNIGMLSPEHVSDAVSFLFSSKAIAINGQNIIIDDGWSL